MPTLVHYVDKQKNPIRDKLGRWIKRIVGAEDDKCVIDGKSLLNKNNDDQVVLYCSKVCRSARHRGLAHAKA